MTKLFNALLLLCGLVLVTHLFFTVAAERETGSRWAVTAEGQAGMKFLALNLQQPYVNGGSPVNSALVLNLTDAEEPPTTDSRLSDVFFDFTGQGRAVKTGWIGFGAGFLVADRDGDGRVDDGLALFGNHTLGGDPLAETGFAALAREDTNHDGIIDARDDIWPHLRVWPDLYTDGHFLRGRLETLESLGITALELTHQQVDRPLRSGNHLGAVGVWRRADGTRGQLDEVYFQEQPDQRQFAAGPTPASADEPAIAGSGLVRDFHEAAARTPALAELRARFLQAPTRAERHLILDDLLTAWAGTGGLSSTLAERVRGRYTLLDDGLDADRRGQQERRLHVLESFAGRYLYLLPDELGPGQDLAPAIRLSGANQRHLTVAYPDGQWARLDQVYDRLAGRIYNELLRTSPRADFWRAWAEEPAGAQHTFDQLLATDPDHYLTELLETRIALIDEIPRDSALDRYLDEKIQTLSPSGEQRQLYVSLQAARSAAEESQARRAAQAARFIWGAARQR